MISATPKRVQWLYNLGLWWLFPLALLATVWDAKKRGGGLRFIQQRFGFGFHTQAHSASHPIRPIWFHAASVGEVNAVAPLIKKFIQNGDAVLVTTSTPTGAQCVHKQLPQAQHAYLPLDYPCAVKRFLRAHTPTQCIVVETELWLNLFSQAKQLGCDPTLISARLSNSTLKHKKLYPLWRACIHQCERVLARNEQDRSAFSLLAPEHPNIEIKGNIKYAYEPLPTPSPILDVPYWLAVSTHDDEEAQIARAFFTPQNMHDDLLVIIPRHAERGEAVWNTLSANYTVARRSTGDAITKETQIYLADTTGEAAQFMPHAHGVFVGGSLIKRGGHNILEPARAGVPTATGPHTDNFTAEVAILKQANAISIINSADELVAHWCELKTHPEHATNMVRSAQSVFTAQAYVIDDYYHLLTHTEEHHA